MYIKINSLNIYYQKIGRGKPLILLHGWGNDVSSFWEVSQKLKDQFSLYLVDLPGFGRSDLPKQPFTVSSYSDVVKKFIQKLNIQKPVILGHSVGGRIAIKLAATNPRLIDKLILEDSGGIRPQKETLRLVFLVMAKIFNFILPNFFNFKKRARESFYQKTGSDYAKAGPLKETLKNIIQENLTSQLSKVKTDTLLIWGENDPTEEASLKHGKLMYRLIPNSRLEILEGVGHFPHLENPERFVYYVKNFC